MNGSITDLGESLAGAYRNKMIQWAAMESIFPAEELSASSGLADDVLHLEKEWQAFAGIGQILQMDFLPQDLLVFSTAALPPEPRPLQGVKKAGDHSFKLPAASGFTSAPAEGSDASLPPEQQPRSSFVRSEHYPFILPADNGLILIPAGAGQPLAENDAAGSNHPAPDSGYDLPEAKPMPLPHPESENLLSGSPENPTQIPRNNVSAISSANLLQAPPEEAPGPLQRQGLISPENLDFSQPDPFSGSIWSQPLQNLGDFAMQIVQPVTEKSGKGRLPASSRIVVPATGPRSPEPDKQAGDESAQLPETPHWPGISNPFEVVPLPGTPESILPAKQMGKPLYTSAPETNRNIPDTDDLLEALTERIIRDFQRYYP